MTCHFAHVDSDEDSDEDSIEDSIEDQAYVHLQKCSPTDTALEGVGQGAGSVLGEGSGAALENLMEGE